MNLLTAVASAAKVCDVIQAHLLVRSYDKVAVVDSGYHGAGKRRETQAAWEVAMRAGKRKVLDLTTTLGRNLQELEELEAGIRAKVDHSFECFKCEVGWA